MEHTLGWGLVGASTIAHEWMIDAIRAQPGNHIAGVMSQSAERGADYAAQHDIPNSYDSLEALLANPAIGAVYISTTNEHHAPQAIAAAAAGKHVICEKPLAMTIDDANAIVQACDAAGVVLGTNHHLRNAAAHQAMRKLIHEGAIGKPLFARVFHAVNLPDHLQGWRINSAQSGGGVILDITVHDTDTLRYLLNSEPTEVSAMSRVEGPVENGVMAVMRFENGVVAQLHDAFNVPYAGTGIEIHGSEGSIFGRDVMTQRATGEVRLRDANGERDIPITHHNLYTHTLAQFNRAIMGECSPSATGQDGVRSLTTALAVIKATQTGSTVKINF